jgi:hypothetical protein
MTPRTTLLSVVLAVALVGSLQPTHAQKPVEAVKVVPVSSECWCAVTVKRYHDIDTIPLCDLQLPYGVVLTNVSLRAADFDALEVDRTRQTVTVTDKEIAEGRRGALVFQKMCDSGQLQVCPPIDGETDPYGRKRGRFRIVIGQRTVMVKEWAAKNGFLRKD